jgi:predicted lactoylglutathione lyase
MVDVDHQRRETGFVSLRRAPLDVELHVAIDTESRADVDALVDKALKAGATKHRDADDHGWMYSRSFADLDGHVWEILFADESLLNGQNAADATKQSTV